MNTLYKVLEDLKYSNNGRIIIPKNSIVEITDDFPWYRIECPELRELDSEREETEDDYLSDFDNYGMEVHMSDIQSEEELPWHNKLKLIN